MSNKISDINIQAEIKALPSVYKDSLILIAYNLNTC